MAWRSGIWELGREKPGRRGILDPRGSEGGDQGAGGPWGRSLLVWGVQTDICMAKEMLCPKTLGA